jgi:hypothetical protein
VKALFAPIDLPTTTPASAEVTEYSGNGGLEWHFHGPGIIARGGSPVGSEAPSIDAKSTALSASVIVAVARLELLRGKSDFLMRFMRLMTLFPSKYMLEASRSISELELNWDVESSQLLGPWKVIEVCHLLTS